MGTIAEKLTYLNDTKTAIKNAIIARDGTIADADKFRDYADGVASIPNSKGTYWVRVIDYDGAVLKETRLNNGDTFTMPEAPTHDGLVFDGWSCSQTITDGVITVSDNNVIAGAMYHTASGATEFDITLNTNTGLSVTLQNITGATSIDWGDNTPPTIAEPYTHTYSVDGSYTIKIYGVTAFGNYVLLQTASDQNYTLTRAKFSSEVTQIGIRSFYNCLSLQNVAMSSSITTISDFAFYGDMALIVAILPANITSIGQQIFGYDYALEDVVIPYCITDINGWFYNCRALCKIVIPNSVLRITSSAFQSAQGLSDIIIPNSVVSISKGFYDCRGLTRIKIPSNLTSLSDSTFYSCYGIMEYDFTACTSVPTLSGTNVFQDINKICKIKIPLALMDEWWDATNWTAFTNYFVVV